MKIFKAVAVLGVCFASIFPTLAGSQKPQKIIAAFDKMSKGKDFRATAPDWVHKEVLRNSPDGKYTARLIVSDGEAGSLTIYRKQIGSNRFHSKYAVSAQIASVEGCVWVPRHSHWIAFSTSGSYGWGTIGLWTGNRKFRWLRRAKSENEGFNIRGVSTNGRTLVYEHYGSNSPDPHNKRKGRLYMRLPRS